VLAERLAQSARDGIAEVEQFRSMWQGPEMKAVWNRVDEKLKESKGDYPQPSGKWERDYDVILNELENEERANEERRRKDEERQEKLKALSFGGAWKGTLESFQQRSLPGMQISPGSNEATITVVLLKSGMVFDIQKIIIQEVNGSFEWQVSSRQPRGRPKTKLETAVVACLNSRGRKWDLSYLLVSFRGDASMGTTAIDADHSILRT
jgi:hypothetical protein